MTPLLQKLIQYTFTIGAVGISVCFTTPRLEHCLPRWFLLTLVAMAADFGVELYQRRAASGAAASPGVPSANRGKHTTPLRVRILRALGGAAIVLPVKCGLLMFPPLYALYSVFFITLPVEFAAQHAIPAPNLALLPFATGHAVIIAGSFAYVAHSRRRLLERLAEFSGYYYSLARRMGQQASWHPDPTNASTGDAFDKGALAEYFQQSASRMLERMSRLLRSSVISRIADRLFPTPCIGFLKYPVLATNANGESRWMLVTGSFFAPDSLSQVIRSHLLHVPHLVEPDLRGLVDLFKANQTGTSIDINTIRKQKDRFISLAGLTYSSCSSLVRTDCSTDLLVSGELRNRLEQEGVDPNIIRLLQCKSCVSIPLTYGDVVVGVIQLVSPARATFSASKRRARACGSEDPILRLLGTIAGHFVGIAASAEGILTYRESDTNGKSHDADVLAAAQRIPPEEKARRRILIAELLNQSYVNKQVLDLDDRLIPDAP